MLSFPRVHFIGEEGTGSWAVGAMSHLSVTVMKALNLLFIERYLMCNMYNFV